jgi:16S rRNA (cytidine1402-2'-O)-methyltransferase
MAPLREAAEAASMRSMSSTTSTPPPRPARGWSSLVDRAAQELEARLAQPLAPGLYLVATPIGNLADITLRALAVMARADFLYCEDTRQSLKLLQRYSIDQRLETYHEHNAERERPRILARLAEGRSVALISDAGTPLISDPGYKLVRASRQAGHSVIAIPGPSAVLAGLVASGLPTDTFHFAGFLPAKEGQRRNRIAALAAVPGTIVLFEAPTRLASCLADLAAALGPRPAALARELTKLNETIHADALGALAEWASAAQVKGECVVVIGPSVDTGVDDETIRRALVEALSGASVRDAASAVAERLGVPRRRVYDQALALSEGKRSGDA